ncbi:HinT-interacting membrane complex lipoprotein P60 [Mycoplasmopsis glycophila]|uniref:P60-like lipoprotein n=1 Tax=Mycoplasmopsis glycophila TaxID=171285 RepID=A0A449AU96_9BACT|nr:hypothetical protein [Mycoplasmopsis glycophila]VEU70066.1 Uncharacterised protein [Mycoplasmopsis glycophila]
MKKALKFLTLLVPTPLVASLVVSCGREQNTLEKTEQDKQLSNKEKITALAENIWLSNTLASLYNVQSDSSNLLKLNVKLLENDNFKADAFKIYNTLLAQNSVKKPGELAKKINTLLSNGTLSASSELESLVTNPYVDEVSEAQFIKLYQNLDTEVARETNKALLVYKYFQIENEESLKKLDGSNFNSNKLKYDTQNFNLIKYAVDKKLAQVWGYTTSNTDAIFAEAFQTINSIAEYNQFLSNKTISTSKISDKLWLNEQNSYQKNLSGYQGVTAISDLAGVSFSFESMRHVANYQANYVGFYNYIDHKIVEINEQNMTVEPVPVARNNSTIDIKYVNVIAPIGKDKSMVTGKNDDNSDKVETIKVLSFEGTPYDSKILELSALLSLNDSNLYQNAQNAFVTLGYLLEKGDNEIFNETIKSLSFVKQD